MLKKVQPEDSAEVPLDNRENYSPMTSDDIDIVKFNKYVEKQLEDHNEVAAKDQKKKSEVRQVGLCEALTRYVGACGKCELFTGVLISFV